MRASTRLKAALALSLVGLAASVSHAQLKASQVLVVYDSRIADSLDIAAYYAGSLKVPGNPTTYPGKHFGVQVLDLANAPGGVPVVTTPGDITWPNFVSRIRTPIRNYLNVGTRARQIRCIVLTKGLPHRIQDTDAAVSGDDPGATSNEFNNGDLTNSSVDSELTLLYQNLETSENGNAGDSRSDGGVLNPYWRATASINNFATDNIKNARTLAGVSGLPGGWVWTGSRTVALTSGDIYLVCRLDGPTLQITRDSIDRAQQIFLNVNNTAFIFDEISSQGIADASPNVEYDNNDLAGFLYSGDDYEKTRDFIAVTDKRFASANVRYNAFGGAPVQFIVGPRVTYTPATQGTLVSTPVFLLASVGSNCGAQSTQPQTAGGINAGQNYADSFNYLNGAIFNSIESYNGRDFGGIGGWTGGWGPQEQVSDFLAAGGTLAVGNVWEPFSFSIADNEWIVKNFVLGNLTWAEAAYSSLPLLSWQQIVIGDPLAIVQRSSEDIDGNGRVDIEDLYKWEQGPTDINKDGTANDADRQLLTATIRRGE
jgi:hypothetical protein